jgi:hypothetical protein
VLLFGSGVVAAVAGQFDRDILNLGLAYYSRHQRVRMLGWSDVP